MTQSDRNLCLFYAAIALAALCATWSYNLEFFAVPDSGGVVGFVRGGFANPAAASLSVDLLFFSIATLVWMVGEARRHEIPYVWAYVVLSFLVAISVTFPLFLIARQRRLAALTSQ